MQQSVFDPAREGGISLVERLILIAFLLFLGIKIAMVIGPSLYDYYIMKDTAKRVAKEYADLNPLEVQRRVKFEFDRAKIVWDEEVFKITRLDQGGYRAEIDLHIPLTIELGDYKLGADKEIRLTHKAEP